MEEKIIEKKPKGRPLKIKDDTETDVVKEEKKRGRKKKITSEVTEPQIIKKRGRKPVAKYYGSTIQTEVSDIPNIESFILKIEKDVNIINEQISETLPHDLNNSELSEYLDQNKEQKNIDIDTEYENIIDLYDKKLNIRNEQDTFLLNNQNNELFNLDENNNTFENSNSEEQTTFNKDLVLHKYMGENWVEKVDTCCFWCCHTFNTTALGLPMAYNKKLGKFRVHGIFCNFPCMIAYHNSQKLANHYLIHFLYTCIVGKSHNINKLIAPPRECLTIFGGTLSIQEFRAVNEVASYRLINYPMYLERNFIEKISIDNVKKNNIDVFNMKIEETTNVPKNDPLDFLKFS
jgi:hypothetical protein